MILRFDRRTFLRSYTVDTQKQIWDAESMLERSTVHVLPRLQHTPLLPPTRPTPVFGFAIILYRS